MSTCLPRTGISVRPSVFTNERDEPAAAEGPLLVFNTRAPAENEILNVTRPYRYGQSPAIAKLFLQRLRNPGCGCCHDDRVIRRFVGPAGSAIANVHMDVVDLQIAEPLPRLVRERHDALYGVHFSCQHGQNRRLIAAAGADLQDLVGATEVQGLRHLGDHERLGDRLAMPDAERVIAVGSAQTCVGRAKQVSRNTPERVQHPRFTNAASDELLVDHAKAEFMRPCGIGETVGSFLHGMKQSA